MNLQDYQNEWTKDSAIDKDKIDIESLQVPKLHSKYLNFLSTERSKLKKLTKKKDVLHNILIDYYLGVIDGKDINRVPWQVTETKASAARRVDADKTMRKLLETIDDIEENVLFLKEVIFSINQRNFSIKNYNDWFKFTQGNQ